MKKAFVQIPALIGLALMSIAIPIATYLVRNNQDNRNKAAYGGLITPTSIIKVTLIPTKTVITATPRIVTVTPTLRYPLTSAPTRIVTVTPTRRVITATPRIVTVTPTLRYPLTSAPTRIVTVTPRIVTVTPTKAILCKQSIDYNKDGYKNSLDILYCYTAL